MSQDRHRAYEDFFALFSASLFVAFGIFLFDSQGILTGGAAGLALLGTHVFPVSFGSLFFIINLPFYYLAWTQLGKRFAINTFISVSVVSVLSGQIGNLVHISTIEPIFAGLFGGLLIGVGMLIMFRHKSSFGGLGILAFYLQKKYGIRAGTFQLAVDVSILTCSFFLVNWQLVLVSILGAAAINIVLTINHRPERYQINPLVTEAA